MPLNYCGETGISYNISRSVTQAVREVLTSNKFYFDVLQSGIANLTALAVKIKPEVEKLAGSSVSTNTIVASLKRVSDRLAENQESMRFDKKIPANLKMSLT